MEIYQLKTFVTVAGCGNVTRAAHILHTTPPSVSTHIRTLESELGITLFLRTAKGMEITPSGELLLEKAQEVLDHVADLFNLAGTLQNRLQGYLKLGINANPEYLKVPGLVATLYDRHPELQVELVPSNSADILNAIEGEQLDCGYIFGEHHHSVVETLPLSVTEICVVVPARWAKKCDGATWSDIAQLPWIVPLTPCPFIQEVERVLKREELVLSNTVFANDDISKMTLIDQGIAVTALEKFEAMALEQAGRATIWRPDDRLQAILSLAFLKRRKQDALLQLLISMVKELWHIGTSGETAC
ncbi:MAG: LysR family transcriptional regulator [Deltaproteobacteria bacterium]|nr:LysR family transcriptional regulator [Deltaproteobacteria bacterium]